MARAIKAYVGELSHEQLNIRGLPIRRLEHWAKPADGVLKLNCDGSFIPGEKCGGWGFLIGDCDGDVVITGRGRVNHVLSALQTELIAGLQGVHTAINVGIGHLLILETDALLVKEAVTTDTYLLSAVGGLVDELKHLLATNFITVCTCFESL